MESFMVRCPPTSKISCSPVSPPGLYGPLIRVCWCFPKLTPILLSDLRHANTVDISKRSAIQIKLLIDLLIPNSSYTDNWDSRSGRSPSKSISIGQVGQKTQNKLFLQCGLLLCWKIGCPS